jgi:hypothetical protein
MPKTFSLQFHHAGRSLLVAAVLALAVPELAASDCKGLEQAACERAEACGWVNGYTTKTGTQVSSHCRSKPKRSGSGSDESKATSTATSTKSAAGKSSGTDRNDPVQSDKKGGKPKDKAADKATDKSTDKSKDKKDSKDKS